jgi:hypothetical protein
MKIKGWHLIILAVVVFFLDFLTLGNRQVIDNPITNKIAFIIALLCVFAFLYGIIKTLRDFISKNKEINKIKWEQEEEKGIRATAVEIGLRRLLAILLIVSVLPLILLLPFIGLILSLPMLLLALYLLFNHRYHLVFDGLLSLLGFLFYFVTFTGNVSYFSLYKSIELSLCPRLITPFLAFMNPAGPLAITRYFFLTASLFLLAGDIIARLKLARKKSLNVISLLTISLVLFFLPFLYVPKVILGTSNVGSTGGEGPSHFLTNNASYHMSYDKAHNTYTFTANMLNQDSNNFASITNICVDGKIIPITKENKMLQVENGIITDGKISVAPGQTAIIKLVSQKPFFFFTLFEGMYRYSTNFLK